MRERPRALAIGADLARAFTHGAAAFPGRRGQFVRKLTQLGGSKAQRDIFTHALVDAACEFGDDADVRAILVSRGKPSDRFAKTVEARLASTARRKVA